MNDPVKFDARKITNFQKIEFKGKIDNSAASAAKLLRKELWKPFALPDLFEMLGDQLSDQVGC